ncbi:MAG: hypothetical protein CBD97_01110 [Pelagibacteraceae bacterium TMED237]|nr:hypothetical protein [Candidatus Neomarinimicrobiota bacterium]OUW96665.1 MAG: hypothetical protein CBD97_01110 [Pelagibacteraceae bacterium TMED237]
MNQNRIFAAVSFLFSLIIYFITMAPTASFWDCGEFIACSYTLGVPHPPGTPLYLLIGNVFSNIWIFVDDIGARVNSISPIVSALSVVLLYLIIVQLIQLINKNENIKLIYVYFSALIGSLVFAFTHSHWFNAVEAEVYSMSTFFTAIVVWLILKWSCNRGKIGNAKFIVLISYLFGLAIGVHLLNLLCIPFVILIIYFKYTDDSFWGFIIDNSIAFLLGPIVFIGLDILGINVIIIRFLLMVLFLCVFFSIQRKITINLNSTLVSAKLFFQRISVPIVSIVVFGLIYIGVIKGLPNMVNQLSKGLNFTNDGISFWDSFSMFYLPLIMIFCVLFGVVFFSRIKSNFFKVSLASMAMIYIGFSTYTLIPIRAVQNPNINENSPDNLKKFLSYMNRDQYGEWNQVDVYNILKYYLSLGSSKENFKIDASRIIESPNIQRWVPFSVVDFDSGGMLSPDEIKNKLSNKNVIDFIKNYQISEMYLRYFGWQFIGKEYNKDDFSWDRNQNTSLGVNIENLSNIDWFRYGLPFGLIFGIIGLFYQFREDPKRALSVLILFIVTGVFIILYLNQYDPQPRERDYSYVGSFFAFSIWIGIGCFAVISSVSRMISIKNRRNKIVFNCIIFSVLFGALPFNYIINDYKYHNRSGNNAAWDYGYNLLNSCKTNSVLFTNGDNDTFPLWYLQEVENLRNDVRVVNLSLLNTPWYINQLYDNNAIGNINFNFDEPIVLVDSKNYDKDIPILKIENSDQYFLDINGNNKFDKYNKEQTKNIIKNLEDPVLGTIYAYKRWAPSSWKEIEENYFRFEIQQSLDELIISENKLDVAQVNEMSILKYMLNKMNQDYYKVKREVELQAKEELIKRYNFEDSFDNVLLGLINNSQKELCLSLWQEYKMLQSEIHFNRIDKYRLGSFSSILNEYINTGMGLYSSSLKNEEWAVTPEQQNVVNYVFPVGSFNPEFNASLYYKNKPINININPTLQNNFFRIQDIMIMKILEDVNYNTNVYFAATVSPDSRINLDSYLSNQGMVYEVTNKDIKDSYSIYVDREILRDNLLEVYRFTNLNNNNIYYNSDLQRILQNYRMLFLYLTEEYEPGEQICLNNNKELVSKSSKSCKFQYNAREYIMSQMDKIMPDNVIKIYNPNLKLYMAELYYYSGMYKKFENYIDDVVEGNSQNLILLPSIALSLSNSKDFIESNNLIKKILKIHPGFIHSADDFLDEINFIIKNKLIDYTFDDESLENMIFDVIFERINSLGINFSEDEVMIYCLQILIKNYNGIYSIEENA